MRSRRDQVQAHAYVVGRLTSALVHGEPDSPESPLRRTGLGSFTGLLLGTLMVAAFLVWGLISTGGKTAALTAGELVMAKETGARYIYAGHELRPVLNWSSAMLLTGGNTAMTVVPAATLTGIAQGQPVGIVGAPDTMPAAGAAAKGAWLVCALSAGHPQVSLTIGTSTPVRPPPPNGALLVRAAGHQVPGLARSAAEAGRVVDRRGARARPGPGHRCQPGLAERGTGRPGPAADQRAWARRAQGR